MKTDKVKVQDKSEMEMPKYGEQKERRGMERRFGDEGDARVWRANG